MNTIKNDKPSKKNSLYVAREIRKKAITGAYTVKQLAQHFNIAEQTVYRILSNQRWDEKTPPINITQIRQEKLILTVKAMVALGFDYPTISKYLGLSYARIS